MKSRGESSMGLTRREFLYLGGAGMAQAAMASLPRLGHAQDKKPKRGGRLRLAARYGTTGLDAHRNQEFQDYQTYCLMYNALTDMGPVPEVKIYPKLAKTWEISADGREYTFPLREEIKFHHGKVFDAHDVKYSIERVMNPATRSPRAFAFKWVDSVNVIDKYQVRIKLKEPFAPFLSTLTLVDCPIIPAGWEPTGTKPAPGTGAFVLKSFVPNESVELTRFPQYWEVDENTGDRFPYVDSIHVKKIVDEYVRLTALRSGDLDFIDSPPLNIMGKAIFEKPLPGIHMNYDPVGNTWIFFNVSKPPYDNKKVRQAFAYAIDKKEIAKAAFWGIGETVNDQPFLNRSPFYIPVEEREINIVKAKQLLAEAGYPNGFETEFINRSVNYDLTGCEIFISQLAKIGVKATMKVLDTAAWLTTLRKGDYRISYRGSTEKYDWDDAYYMHLHSGEIGKNNFSRYVNKDLDPLLEKGRITWRWEDRVPIYRRVIEIIREDLPQLYVGKPGLGVAFGDHLKGFRKGFAMRYAWHGGGVKYWWLDK